MKEYQYKITQVFYVTVEAEDEEEAIIRAYEEVCFNPADDGEELLLSCTELN